MRTVTEELMCAVEDQIDATHDKNPAAIEKERLWNLVSDITLFTMANREVLLKEAAKEQEDLLDRIEKEMPTSNLGASLKIPGRKAI